MDAIARVPVLETIRDAIETRTCVSVVGLPGSGRSDALSLVREAAEDDGWTVLSVPSHGASTGRPLESLVLAGLVTGPPGALGALATARQAIVQAAATGPTLFLLDDADALDDTSAAVLASVLDRRDTCVVATVRPPYPGSASVDRVLASRQSTTVWLPALPIDEIHRMASQVLGGHVDADVAGRIYALSGGLTGIARTIMIEARRAGHLVPRGERWVARRDLWTPALAVVVHRLLTGLDDDDVAALRILAALGPADPATVRRLVPWSSVARLDDQGLLRFVDPEGEPLVVLYPPLLGDHLRQTGRSARGQEAVATINAILNRGDHAIDPPSRPVLGPPFLWSSSPESAAIQGRVLREHSVTRLLACRDTWEHDPTSRNTVKYLDALVDSGDHRELIDSVLKSTREDNDEPPEYVAFVRSWEASYLALVLHDPAAAHEVLVRAAVDDPDHAAILAAVEEHIRLIGPPGASAALALPWPDLHDLADSGDEVPPTHGGIIIQGSHVVGTIRSETLLAQGRVHDAAHDLAALGVPAAATRRDSDVLSCLALVCSGEIEEGTERSMRLLDEARVSLDRAQIEPHGYVVALGLHLQGRLATLREHLTTVFALGAYEPLRPSMRAGLLALGATLSQMEGNLPSARSMVAQMELPPLLSADLPIARPEPVAAATAMASGHSPRESTRAGWTSVTELAAHGYVLAAVFDAARLVDLWPDVEVVHTVARLAAAAQGEVLPALGQYLLASVSGAPDVLLQTAQDLRARHLTLHATRAHAAAVRLLRDGKQTARAAEEAAHLRQALTAAGEDLHLVVPSLVPAAALTSRELEVARLVAAGLSNKDVADRLVVSERTVDNHVYRIFRKLGIRSRDEISRVL